jgi:SAM-dependent methyltransferase
MHKQVEKSHYEFKSYINKRRWVSIWHQIDEIVKLEPQNVLEIGPGPGLFSTLAKKLGVPVETLDIDPELQPDYLASVFDMPFEDCKFDVVCAFQMLEHLPFERSLLALQEMARVCKNAMVISLPDAASVYSMSMEIPRLGLVQFAIPKPKFRPTVHRFNGEHYWELNKRDSPLRRVMPELERASGMKITRTFRVHENQYHRFFIFVR